MKEFSQKYYQANLAGLLFHCTPHQGGFSLKQTALVQKQLDFLYDLLKQICRSQEDFSQSFSAGKNKPSSKPLIIVF